MQQQGVGQRLGGDPTSKLQGPLACLRVPLDGFLGGISAII